MVQVQSKLAPIRVTCAEYVHPWTDSCLEAISGCYLYAVIDSFRIYATVYLLALLMKGKRPTRKDLKRTLYGILQSTAFLSGTAFGYSFFLCSLRRLLGNFNLLTVSAIPAFLSSVFSILIERPSRRLLLCLYVSNVATETFWNMGLARDLVRPVRYGQVGLFSASMAALLFLYKRGLHKRRIRSSPDSEEKIGEDSMFGVLRFLVGSFEEYDPTEQIRQASTFYRQRITPERNDSWTSPRRVSGVQLTLYGLIMGALRAYKQIVNGIKSLSKQPACLHPFSCMHYTLSGAGKMAGIGLAIQVSLKLIFNLKRVYKSPTNLFRLLFRRDSLSLVAFLGGFVGLYRGINCLLRGLTGQDSPYHAIPAGFIAGTAFTQYPDATVALYVLWKTAQITYTLGIDRGILPRVPGFTEFLYCFSTATLFHAALLEPVTMRPSYWKFLHSISGGRIACMNRNPLDVWGLNTSQALRTMLKRTNTQQVVQFYGGCACS